MQGIATDLGEIPEWLRDQVVDELRTGVQKQIVEAQINAQRIGASNYRQDRKSIEGIGRLRLRVDAGFYAMTAAVHGPDCWKDEGWLRDVEKWHPEFRVKCGGTRLQVGYHDCSPPKRFSKTYAL